MTNEKMKGKLASAISLLIFCACFMVGIGLAAAAPSLSVDPALTDGLASTDTFSVNVDVDSDGAALAGLDFNMAYDTSALSVTGATYSGIMGTLAIEDYADDGEITLAVADLAPASQSGTVLTVNFEVKAGAADGTYNLDLKDAALVNNGGSAIMGVVINDGQAKVGNGVVIPPTENPFMEIVADSGIFGEGDTFQATVALDSDGIPVSGAEFNMAYDSSALSVTGATYSGAMGPLSIEDFTDDGEISLTVADATPVAQAGTVLTINFEVNAGVADGIYTLDLKDVVLIDDTPAAIPGVGVIDDTVEVQTIVIPEIEGIVLMPGWNLISIPETLEDPSMANVLQDFDSSMIDSVFYDDASSGMMVVPTDFEPLKAYWVHNNMTEAVVINEDYLTPMVPSTPPSLMLYPGWNAVGHTASVELSAEVALSTIDDCYSKVQGPWMPSASEYAYIGYNEMITPEDNHVSTDDFRMDVYEGFYVFVDEECMLA